MTDRLGAALDALLDPSPQTVLATEAAVEASGWPADEGHVVPDRAVVSALRQSEAQVLLVHRVSMTLLRALRSRPVTLVVLTADAEPSRCQEVGSIAGIHVLGPAARVRRGTGSTLCCAAEPGELEGLWRALGGARLAVCPTPGFWWQLLDRKAARRYVGAGYVPASVLDEQWAQWAVTHGRGHVLVPLGVPPAPVDDPGHDDLAPALAAHALERWTGPVFPAPRVIASVLDGLQGTASPPDGTAPDSGIWQQARRALPMTGALVGMDRARPDLATHVATAAFLAQRALLRAEAAQAALLDDEPPAPLPVDEQSTQRSTEVLTSAGTVLTDHESKVVLRGFGIEVTRQAVASSASGAAGFAERIGFPVALKALSPDLRRRTDIGALALSLDTAAAVRRAYGTIVDAVERNAPTARLDGVLVAEMIEPGLDVHCGAIRLPSGTMAIFGRCIDPTAPIEPVLAPRPLETEDARLLAHAILGRVPVPALRRTTDPDPQALAALLLHLDAIADHFDDRLELIELRPVRLLEGERRYVTLDARIVQRAHLQGT
ncbi:MAG: acetate--CoA ligase family protein [Deltaproteobacteria bacterium]|nr:acetate--CoA ligase family protein [Deltaproteobacteria bacterium]